MDTDFLLVVGAGLILLAVPNAIKAYSEVRSPRVATGMVVAGGVMFVSALVLHPEGYRFEDIPEAVLRVISRIRSFFHA
ncbi:hypothetical protein [Celeribacter naphthalenivorans]|uniref:hypothetical protein n=1 Tax=Celeribacter naphthalenivorans TaxID=1614694 RepID=UPI001CFBB8F4|nr:hypothetical protein [Celeribacter naphthalenivorans]